MIAADALLSNYGGLTRHEVWWEIPIYEVFVYLRAITWRKSKEWGGDKDEPLGNEMIELLEVIETVRKEQADGQS